MSESLITVETAAKIWRALSADLLRPGQEQMKKMATAAMAGDTSTDHIESKTAIARVAYGMVCDTPELKEECAKVTDESSFIKALADHFLHEPALTARSELYSNLGLPPPDETGGSLTARIASK